MQWIAILPRDQYTQPPTTHGQIMVTTFWGPFKWITHAQTCHQSHHILGFKEVCRTLGQKEYMRQYINFQSGMPCQ